MTHASPYPDRPSCTAPSGPVFDRLCQRVAQAWPPHRFADVTTMVAVSGGADSVGLLRTLLRLRPPEAPGQLVVLHFNHRLRGDDSDADEQFVADLARSLDLECQIGRASDATSLDSTDVAEATLRSQRYAFFDAAAHRRGARYVVTAHTADDNAETMLHNAFRGTGPVGLAGIPPHRALGADVVLVRPLLTVRRCDVRDALREIGQGWREDASNLDPRWQRNWIRGSLLPEIRTRYPDADRALVRLAQQQAEMLQWLRAEAARWADQHVRGAPGGPLRIDRRGRDAPRPVVIAALGRAWDGCQWPRGAMAERHWNVLAKMIATGESSGHNAPVNLPGSLRATVTDCGSVVVAATVAD